MGLDPTDTGLSIPHPRENNHRQSQTRNIQKKQQLLNGFGLLGPNHMQGKNLHSLMLNLSTGGNSIRHINGRWANDPGGLVPPTHKETVKINITMATTEGTMQDRMDRMEKIHQIISTPEWKIETGVRAMDPTK
jgi:hypothetical protein